MNAGTSSASVAQPVARRPRERHERRRHALAVARPLHPPTTARAKSSGERKPREFHRQLHQVDPGRAEQAAGDEVDEHDAAGGDGPDPSRPVEHDLQNRRGAQQLPGQDRQRHEPDDDAGRTAHHTAVAPLEEIAEGEKSAVARPLPQPRPCPQRKRNRANTGRRVPPPRSQADSVPDARGAHRGASPDVGGQKRREDQQRWKATPGHEEIGRAAHAPPDPQADAELQRDEGGKQPDCDRHPRLAGQFACGRQVRQPAGGLDGPDDGLGRHVGGERSDEQHVRRRRCGCRWPTRTRCRRPPACGSGRWPGRSRRGPSARPWSPVSWSARALVATTASVVCSPALSGLPETGAQQASRIGEPPVVGTCTGDDLSRRRIDDVADAVDDDQRRDDETAS